eukprot:tig00000492_g1391.t1
MPHARKKTTSRRLATSTTGLSRRTVLGHKSRGGVALKTTGGLTAKDLTRNKHGEIVSVKRRRHAAKHLSEYNRALIKARRRLGITGFVPVGARFYIG